MSEKIKVLVVDDAAFMRKSMTQMLDRDPGIEVVGAAKNGREGIDMVKRLKPDVVTMDIDMPVMNGLSATKHIMIECPVPVVVLSSLTNDGIVTFEALRLGVVDFVPKPSGAVSPDINNAERQIIDRIKIALSVNLDNIRRVMIKKQWNREARLSSLYGFYPMEYLIAVGTTLSGPNTVIRLVANLPPTVPAAMVVIQEISPRIIESFVREFNENVPWKVVVAEDGMPLEQGTCYIGSTELPVEISYNKKGDPCLKSIENTGRPLNKLFASAAGVFHQHAIGVLLTGVGSDGTAGFNAIKNARGMTIAQAADCCVYPNLTANAVAAGVVDKVLDDDVIADYIRSMISEVDG
jgi:two-component system, chemotaxis family, protein-glutamate methylesterase/glutaminase